jgi:hypothetical protein
MTSLPIGELSFKLESISNESTSLSNLVEAKLGLNTMQARYHVDFIEKLLPQETDRVKS